MVVALFIIDRNRKTFRQFLHNPRDPNSISNNVIVSLCIDHASSGYGLVPTFGGLDCYDGKKFTHYRHTGNPNSLSDNRVWEIFEDSRKELWIGTLNGGLERLDRQKNIFHHYTFEQPGFYKRATTLPHLLED